MSVDKGETWQERADELARNMRLDIEIARLSRPGMLAAEMAEALPDDLRSLYWRRKLDAYFAGALTEPGMGVDDRQR